MNINEPPSHVLPKSWFAEHADNPSKLLHHLMAVVNTITAPHRHGNPIPKSRLNDLCETQLRIEEAIREKK